MTNKHVMAHLFGLITKLDNYEKEGDKWYTVTRCVKCDMILNKVSFDDDLKKMEKEINDCEH